MSTNANLKNSFLSQGFCTFKNILDSETIRDLGQLVDERLVAQSQEHFEAQKSTGSMLNVRDDERFANLISQAKALECLASLGFDKPKWSSGFVISKPGHSPALFWHQDWWGWNHDSSYKPECQMAFLMYYLVDTRKENGCLRVIPGSHVKRHSLHDALSEEHAVYRRMDNPEHPAYQFAEGEVDVEVKAGDLIFGDARLLHSAHANQTDQRRTVITLWFFPDFDNLPQQIKASINPTGRHGWPEHWSSEQLNKIKALETSYEGAARPIPWNRIPDERLT